MTTRERPALPAIRVFTAADVPALIRPYVIGAVILAYVVLVVGSLIVMVMATHQIASLYREELVCVADLLQADDATVLKGRAAARPMLCDFAYGVRVLTIEAAVRHAATRAARQ